MLGRCFAVTLAVSLLALGASGGAPVAARAETTVKSVLSSFHQRAAKADFEGYFDLFHPNGVFLGTDGSERWPLAEFKEFARPHFEGDSAWVFVPTAQNVTVAPGGGFAWFDEVLESKSYGVCRGSGVVIETEGGWKIGQYHLTVPIPNELLRDFVARIRGQDRATRIIALRHSEKERRGDDPGLTPLGGRRARTLAAVLRDVPVDQVFATPYRRTQLTAEPTATAKKLEVEIVPAPAFEALAERIRKEFAGRTVMYAGHSNTVPQLIRALGVPTDLVLTEADYDDVFVITLRSGTTPELLRLHVPVSE